VESSYEFGIEPSGGLSSSSQLHRVSVNQQYSLHKENI
jgi:hypothetical protein